MLSHILLVTCDICSFPVQTNQTYYNMPLSKINLLLLAKLAATYCTRQPTIVTTQKTPLYISVVTFRQSLVGNSVQREWQYITLSHFT
jgi:hypothetical protein